MYTHRGGHELQIGKVALLFNDLETIEQIAEVYLTDPQPIALGRHQIRGRTGFYEGEHIALVAIGIGMPSAAFYAQELLLHTETEALIRVGLAHGLNNAVQTHELVMAQAACAVHCAYTGSCQTLGEPATIADFALMQTADRLAGQHQVAYRVGCLASVDDAQITYQAARDQRLAGAIAMDMETAALYAVATRLQRRALSLNLVARRLVDPAELRLENISTTGSQLLKLALSVAQVATVELKEAADA